MGILKKSNRIETAALYCIKDKVSEKIMGMQPYNNQESAIRDFDLMCSQENSLMHFRPKDFALVYLGEIDLSTGLISSVEPTIVKEGV